MKKVSFLVAFLISAFVFAQKPIFVAAKVKAVTVYFNTAEISQTTTALLPKGTSEIVIKNVSDYINENTIQIGAPATVTILSTQFTNNYISEYDIDERNPVIKKVRDSINLVKKELQKVKNASLSENKTIELLDKNQQISGVNSGLNVMELAKMVDYYKLKRTEASNNYDALQEKAGRLNDLLEKLSAKLEINSSKEEKTSSGKLVIQVMNEIAGNVDLSINYLSNSAFWKPFYDLRSTSVAEPISIMYKAQVVQNTGIDWTKVKLTLSSGNPNQNNQSPSVNPWFLRYQEQDMVRPMAARADAALEEIVVTAYGKSKKADKYVRAVSNNVLVNENQLSISFDIDVPYDILSNGKAHSVALKELKIPATYKYFVAPKLEKEAFLLAEIADYAKYNLLDGEANIIFEGIYVGKTNIETNQTSDTLHLSMGRDKKIIVKREKVVDKSSTKFLSTKKEQTFTYDITIRNNKKEAAQISINDQYPLSSDKEIEIALLQNDGAKVNTETGILTWDLDLKPNETKKIRLSYSVKYPKEKQITNL